MGRKGHQESDGKPRRRRIPSLQRGLEVLGTASAVLFVVVGSFFLLRGGGPTAAQLRSGLDYGRHLLLADLVPAAGGPVGAGATLAVKHLSGGTLIWYQNFESGSVAPFQVWRNGRSEVKVVQRPSRTGGKAAALTINPRASHRPGMRLAVPYLEDGSKLPDRAYYSAWYLIPTHVTTPWDNIFQFKQHDPRIGASNPVWTVTIRNRPSTGAMYLAVSDHVGEDGEYRGDGWGARAEAPAGIDLPVGRWFQLECLYVWSTTDGRFTCWQDGKQLWDIAGEQTEYDVGPPRSLAQGDLSRQWSVNNYSDETRPSPLTIYVDDAAISKQRLGPTYRLPLSH